jgi:hypothetical protein
MHCFFRLVLISLFLAPFQAKASDSVAGQYFAILNHDETSHFQYAKVTLTTVNPGGSMKISANVIVYFGEPDSNEYLTYEFVDIPFNLLTRQVSLKNESADISFIGTLKNNEINGDWFATSVGKVGTFEATKQDYPTEPVGFGVVRSLSGRYQGELVNENPESSFPERITMAFVTTQESEGTSAIHVTGYTRFYLGEFSSQEYVELKFTDIQFNFYNRFLTAKTDDYGLTYKGYMNEDGSFDGLLFSDGLGKIGPARLTKQ